MADYIERKAALAKTCEGCIEANGGTCEHKCADYCAIAELPTADVVKVVRCEDCQYFSITPYGKEIGRGCCDLVYKIVHLNHFCSYGIAKMNRKDEE